MGLIRNCLYMWALVLIILPAILQQVSTAVYPSLLSNSTDSTTATVASVESPPAAFNTSTMDRLRLNLFTNYDKNAHPMTSKGDLTNVTLSMQLYYIDIDEKFGKVTVHAWVQMSWVDAARAWNPAEYDNITIMNLNPRDIWKPKVTLLNSASNDGDYLGDTKLVLNDDGEISWIPPAIYTAYCHLNLQLWPYDTQTCNVNVGSWNLVTINPRNKSSLALTFDDVMLSAEWDVIEHSAVYKEKGYCNYVEFTFKLQRLSSMYTAVIFTPASCIILLTLSTFWLPPQMTEKLLLNGIVIVVIAVFLMYFAQLLPIMSDNTPLIVLFYSTSLLFVSLATIIAVIVLYLSTAKHKRRIPNFLQRIFNGPLGNVLLLSQFTLESQRQKQQQQQQAVQQDTTHINDDSKELHENVYDNLDDIHTVNVSVINGSISDMENTTPQSIQFGWLLLATAIDRISFLIFSFIFIVLAIVYSV